MIKKDTGSHSGLIFLFPQEFGGRKTLPPEELPWRPILQSENGARLMAEITSYQFHELEEKRIASCMVRFARPIDQLGRQRAFFIRERTVIGVLTLETDGS